MKFFNYEEVICCINLFLSLLQFKIVKNFILNFFFFTGDRKLEVIAKIFENHKLSALIEFNLMFSSMPKKHKVLYQKKRIKSLFE